MADFSNTHEYPTTAAAAFLTKDELPTVDTAAVIAEQAAKINELKRDLDAARLRGENRTIEVDGKATSVKDASILYDQGMQDLHLLNLRAERMVAEGKALNDTVVSFDGTRLNIHQRPEPSTPVLNRDSAEKLFGRTG